MNNRKEDPVPPQNQPQNSQQREPTPQYSPPPVEHGEKYATKQETHQELDQAIAGTDEVLSSIITPFQIMPKQVKLDRSKILVRTDRVIYKDSEISVPIEYVLNVTAKGGFILSYLHVYERILGEKKLHKLGPFWKEDAKKFARIAQGYVMALKRQIDLSPLEKDEMVEKLYNLGENY